MLAANQKMIRMSSAPFWRCDISKHLSSAHSFSAQDFSLDELVLAALIYLLPDLTFYQCLCLINNFAIGEIRKTQIVIAFIFLFLFLFHSQIRCSHFASKIIFLNEILNLQGSGALSAVVRHRLARHPAGSSQRLLQKWKHLDGEVRLYRADAFFLAPSAHRGYFNYRAWVFNHWAGSSPSHRLVVFWYLWINVALYSCPVCRGWPSNLWWSCWQWRRNRRPGEPSMRRSTRRFLLFTQTFHKQLIFSWHAKGPETFGVQLSWPVVLWSNPAVFTSSWAMTELPQDFANFSERHVRLSRVKMIDVFL